MRLKSNLRVQKSRPTSLPTFLYSDQYPGGKLFDAMKDDIESLMRQGWVDSPALLNAATTVQGTDAIVDAAVKAEKNRQKGEQSEQLDIAVLDSVFAEEPESLTKEELKQLGAHYGLKLSLKSKEATLIKEIQALIQEGSENEE